MEKERCPWPLSSELYKSYHDHEWGVPCRDELRLFEMINLEGAQAGLSWITILKKRENYRALFDNFDPEKMASYDQNKIDRLLSNPGIVRNKLKVNAFITNAKLYLELKNSGVNFSDYLWQFVDNKVIVNNYQSMSEVPAKTDVSDAMSKALKKQGFKFVGSTICYAFMQACGMVNDHLVGCYRHKECIDLI